MLSASDNGRFLGASGRAPPLILSSHLLLPELLLDDPWVVKGKGRLSWPIRPDVLLDDPRLVKQKNRILGLFPGDIWCEIHCSFWPY